MRFDRQQMLALINRTPTLTAIYMDTLWEKCPTGFDENICTIVIEEMFKQYVLDGTEDIKAKYISLNPTARHYVDIIAHTDRTKEIERLIHLNGWKNFINSLVRYVQIKQSEMQNGGFDDQVIKWHKIEEVVSKIGRHDVML